jgi:hypothetical protein
MNSPAITELAMDDSGCTFVPARTCFMCGALASFGFNTRAGVVWTCMSHRSEGDKLLVAPASSGNKTPPGRAAGGGR